MADARRAHDARSKSWPMPMRSPARGGAHRRRARAAVTARGRFMVAVSGGRTPWVMLRALAAQDVPWTGVHVLQVDERIAPAGDADRNLTHLRASLLARRARSPRRSTRCPWSRPTSTRRPRAMRRPCRHRRIAAGPRSRPSRPGPRRTHRVAGARRSGARGHRHRRGADRRLPGPAPDDADLSGPQPRPTRAVAGHRRGEGRNAGATAARRSRHSRRAGPAGPRAMVLADRAAARSGSDEEP